MFLKRLNNNHNNTPCLLPFLSSWTFSFPPSSPLPPPPLLPLPSLPLLANRLLSPSLLSGSLLPSRARERARLAADGADQPGNRVSLSLPPSLSPSSPLLLLHTTHIHAHAHTYTHTHTRKHSKLGPAAPRLLQSLQKASERPPVRARLTPLRLRARRSAKSRCPARPLRPGVPENKAGREGTDRSENTPATHAATSALAGSPRGDGAGSALRG